MWIVGSSIIKDAFVSARSRHGGTCLGLSRLNVSIWWQGKRGMVARQIKGQIRLMKKFEVAPQFIILHVAGNDLGCKKVGALRNEIKYIIRWILIELPNTTIIWSQILPRPKWRYSENQTAMHEVVTELLILLHPLLQNLVVIISGTQIYAETIHF